MLGKKISTLCKNIRKGQKVLVKDFSKICGVSLNTIHNFESGRNFNIKLVEKYALLVGKEEFEKRLKEVF